MLRVVVGSIGFGAWAMAMSLFPHQARAQPDGAATISAAASYLMIAHACAEPLGDPSLPDRAYEEASAAMVSLGYTAQENSETLGALHEQIRAALPPQNVTKAQCIEALAKLGPLIRGELDHREP